MKSILIIGLGRFGKHMIMKMNELNHQIMAIDKKEELVNDVLPYVTNAQIGDATNEYFLKSLGVGDYDMCIVAIGNDFQSSLETTSLLKDFGAKLVISRAARDIQAKFLLRNGADEVIYPEKQIARWAAVRYGADHILDFIEIDDSHAIYEVTMPENWIGKSIGQIDIRKKYGINIISIKQGNKLNLSVSPDMILQKDETMLVLGAAKSIRKCFHV